MPPCRGGCFFTAVPSSLLMPSIVILKALDSQGFLKFCMLNLNATADTKMHIVDCP